MLSKKSTFIKYLLFNNPTTLFLQLSLLSIHPTLTGPNASSTDPNEGSIPLDSSQQHYNLEAGRPTHSSLGTNIFKTFFRIFIELFNKEIKQQTVIFYNFISSYFGFFYLVQYTVICQGVLQLEVLFRSCDSRSH